MSDLISRDFKGIWISRDIWLSKELSLHAKCLWAEIDSLFNKDEGGCYASDEYLEEFLNVKRSRLHEIFKELTDKGYLIKVSFDGRRVIRKAITPEFSCGQQLSAIPDSSNPESRIPNVRDSGQPSYIENKVKRKEQQQAAAVVPSNKESFDILKESGFDDKTAVSLSNFLPDRIIRQCNNLKHRQTLIEVENPLGWLRSAIENDWSMSESKESIEEKKQSEQDKKTDERLKIKALCEKLYDQYENKFIVNKYFDMGIDVISCKSGDRHFMLPYDDHCLVKLKKFIKENFT